MQSWVVFVLGLASSESVTITVSIPDKHIWGEPVDSTTCEKEGKSMTFNIGGRLHDSKPIIFTSDSFAINEKLCKGKVTVDRSNSGGLKLSSSFEEDACYLESKINLESIMKETEFAVVSSTREILRAVITSSEFI